MKFTSIVFLFLFSFSFANNVFADAIITTLNITTTSVTLSASGLEVSTQYTIKLVSDSGTVAYTNNQSVTSNNIGTAVTSTPFSGLVPGGSYTASVIHLVDGTVATLDITTLLPSAPTATPSPLAGPFTSTQSVTLSSITSGSSFRYVDDASTPTCSLGSTTNPFQITTTKTIKAIACDPHGVASAVASFTYTINSSGGGNPPPVPTGGPTTTGVGGADYTSTLVTLSGTALTPNSQYGFSVYSDTGTASYYQNQSGVTSDSNGNAEAGFSGLTPGGNYKGYVIDGGGENAVAPISFTTLMTDPIVVGGGGGGGDGGNVGSGGGSGISFSGLVPCGTKQYPKDTKINGVNVGSQVTNPCGFNDLMALINKVVRYILFILLIPIAAMMFAYSGFLFITSGGEANTRTKAKKVLMSVIKGIVFAVGAWLIINVILTTLGYDGSWIGF